ncbi:hypothetical protein [Pseudomonas fluorescens]|uniref:hypothetical protein n=1 Tax=Pseudomonas TaxID=286 RepID=UPI003D08C5D0
MTYHTTPSSGFLENQDGYIFMDSLANVENKSVRFSAFSALSLQKDTTDKLVTEER